tara:strand:- start:397 stop:645 length:249 start_codon:yes stop_codon:yes gene_type:complete
MVKSKKQTKGKTKTKNKCYKLKNPWYDILINDILKKNNTISKSQKKKWCNEHKKLKKTYNCLNEYNSKKEFKLSKWDKICNL